MKKGFTLIELLAVIVILAIIALIATPIILGIINDARKESNERSAELYASSVKNAIAAYQLTHPNAPTKFVDLDIQYDGEVECAKEELYSDGSFYIAECTVNGDSVDYTYGEQQYTQIYKPQYYYFGENIEVLTSDAKTSALEIDTLGLPFYLGLDVDSNNYITGAYTCFVRNEREYCLKAWEEKEYETNVQILQDAYNDNVCSFEEDSSYCRDDGLEVSVNSMGIVIVGTVGDNLENVYGYCTVDGIFSCGQY